MFHSKIQIYYREVSIYLQVQMESLTAAQVELMWPGFTQNMEF